MRMERDEVIRRLKEIAFHNDDHTDNLALAALEWIEEYRRQAELYADNIQRTMEVRDEYKRQLDAARQTIAHWQANHADMVRRNKALQERPDLPAERVEAYRELMARLDAVKAERDLALSACRKLAELDWCIGYDLGPKENHVILDAARGLALEAVEKVHGPGSWAWCNENGGEDEKGGQAQ